MKEKKYISLKEAAAISGYSADYIGQLIRKGKLKGKQVYLNVAWMTTEDDLQAYMTRTQKGEVQQLSFWELAWRRIESPASLLMTYRVTLWIALGFLTVIILFLVVVLSITIDHKIEHSYQQKILYEN